MSKHGVCFDNGMSGHCNLACSQYLDRFCPIPEDMVPEAETLEDLKTYNSLYGIQGIIEELLRLRAIVHQKSEEGEE